MYYNNQPGEPSHQPYGPWNNRPTRELQQQLNHQKLLRSNSNAVCFALLAYFLLSLLIPLALGFAFQVYYLDSTPSGLQLGYNEMPGIVEFINLISYVVSFIIPCLMLVATLRIPWRVAFPLRMPKASIMVPAIPVCLGASVLGVTLSSALAAFLEIVFDLVPTMPDLSPPSTPAGIVFYTLNVVVAAAVLEEAMFRGVIMQSLRRFGDGFALVVSAILFALTHGNLVQGPNALLLGLVIGYFVLRSGSLLTGIVLHMINNGLSVLLQFAAENISDEQLLGVLSTFLLALYVVGGILGLMALQNRYGSVFLLNKPRLPYSKGWKLTHFFTTVGFVLFFVLILFVTSRFFE